MTPEQKAFNAIFPSWVLVRQGEKTGARYAKGQLTIWLINLESGPRATLQIQGENGPCTKGVLPTPLKMLLTMSKFSWKKTFRAWFDV